ncbi:Hint domain-containing protein [Aliiruegeria haliotis]|uniref:Hint domain-containing protein n=1 Tax=Aliiruegeria haliotis TaxID=1280846 RepID=A0A2T0RR48_9RHOB|nr:Hint domain-containing protein [Aliiruegeria haliotis]PRY23664.1 Hint domain-containing protein [Aliiruegeria haliotis]
MEMGTGFEGTFVIPWSQTITDGIPAAPASEMRAGVTWVWTGQATRVDGPGEIGLLGGAIGSADLHARAARKARQIVGQIGAPAPAPLEIADDQLLDRCFVLTDGRRAYVASRIEAGPQELAMFLGELPPQGVELWVVRKITSTRAEKRARQAGQRSVICFAAGAAIATPKGPRPVENLLEGDLVLTRDDGPQPVLWTGRRRMSGARLHTSPQLRPIRLRASALASNRPDSDLLVSPGHRILLQDRAAFDLFGEPEVLVRAEDLCDRPGIVRDVSVASVTYVHLMLEHHQILTVNGVPSESFHPDEADLDELDPLDREDLLDLDPSLATDPWMYGAPARRRLTSADAAILVSRSLAA